MNLLWQRRRAQRAGVAPAVIDSNSPTSLNFEVNYFNNDFKLSEE